MTTALRTARTTTCTAHGHRELTLQLATLPVGLESVLLDYFESAVAAGTTFTPDQTVQLGGAILRVCEREDGTLGLEERTLDPTPTWIEEVDRALLTIWRQREVVAGIGLLERITFASEDQTAMVADCVFGPGPIVMSRLGTPDAPADFSGWAIACSSDHDHGERTFVPLRALAAKLPVVVPFLALPMGASVHLAAGVPTIMVDGVLRGPGLPPPTVAPQAYPDHAYLGSFTLGPRTVIGDSRAEPPAVLRVSTTPGTWHAYLRTTRRGEHAALLAVHADHLTAANTAAKALGGDLAAACAPYFGAAKRELPADVAVFVALRGRHERAVAKEPAFVARWEGGPVTVSILDAVAWKAAPHPSTPTTDRGAGVVSAGCWAVTSTADNWSAYGVKLEGQAVVLRVRLSLSEGHQHLVDATTSAVGARLFAAATESGATSAPYARTTTYQVGDELTHPTFGVGRVQSVEGTRVVIAFTAGVKTLSHGAK